MPPASVMQGPDGVALQLQAASQLQGDLASLGASHMARLVAGQQPGEHLQVLQVPARHCLVSAMFVWFPERGWTADEPLGLSAGSVVGRLQGLPEQDWVLASALQHSQQLVQQQHQQALLLQQQQVLQSLITADLHTLRPTMQHSDCSALLCTGPSASYKHCCVAARLTQAEFVSDEEAHSRHMQ